MWRPLVVSILVVLAASCGGSSSDDGGSGGGGGSGGTAGNTCAAGLVSCATGCCPCLSPDVLVRVPLDGEAPSRAAALRDLDGDGRSDLVLVHDKGLRVHLAGECPAFGPSRSVLPDLSFVGLQAATLADGVAGVLGVTGDGELHGLGGAALDRVIWDALSIAKGIDTVVPAHLDGDGDHDAVVFTDGYTQLLRMENTGTGFRERTRVELPAGITRAVAGDLGGGPRDEIAFLGDGAVLVVSSADFDYSDIRTVSGEFTTAGAIADADGDGKNDLWLATGSTLLLHKGDGETGLAAPKRVNTSEDIRDIVVVDGGARLAFAHEGGTVGILSSSDDPEQPVAVRHQEGTPRHLLAGDVDGDGNDDLVVITTSGEVWLWLVTPRTK